MTSEMETDDPIALFGSWLEAAWKTEPSDANAMTLATIDPEGRPQARIVLLKGHNGSGFVFYTNTFSRKGLALEAVPFAALCFHWKTQRRQVRIEGQVGFVTDEEADEYFASRPRDSRIGAWASQQSQKLESRTVLEDAVKRMEAEYAEKEVPRPPHWSGYRVRPERIEFWQEGAFRLHDRIEYLSTGGNWVSRRLYP